MESMTTVQAQVDADIERRASEVLERVGLTIAEAVREMLTRTAIEGTLPFPKIDDEAEAYGENNPEYEAWFHAKVQEALDDPRPGISHDEAELRMAKRRAALLAKAS